MARRKYTVIYERDGDGWWTASVPKVAGCHTQGRSLGQARERIREALALYVPDAERAELIDNVRLPQKANVLIGKYRHARNEAQHWAARTRFLAWKAAHEVAHRTGLSVRDAAELLELSHQRVQQILNEEEPAPPSA